ncbi:MAG: hypothetical protein ACHQ0I_04745 [Candidatus Lutacidiplasmatales archaeon]
MGKTVEDAEEGSVSGVEALSVTASLNEYAELAARVPPGTVHVSTTPGAAPAPLVVTPHWVADTNGPPSTETSHCQEYVSVPVVGIIPEIVRTRLALNACELGVGAAGGVSAVLLRTVAEPGEEVDSADEALSVTRSSKEYATPAGNVLAERTQDSASAPLAPMPLFVVHRAAGAYGPALIEISHTHA